MANSRNNCFSSEDLVASFKYCKGYYNYSNRGLANLLISLRLLEDINRKNPKNVGIFIKWSFSVSFLQMINAWQWFLSGILLGRQAYLPTQIMQMYYYSIFFANLSFLAAQLKGIYTVNIKNLNQHFLHYKNIHRCIWLDNTTKIPFIALDTPKGKGGGHEKVSLWFYQVFNNWDLKKAYPYVITFVKEAKWHINFRNLYTYSLGGMAEELYSSPKVMDKININNKTLNYLWDRQGNLIGNYPEEVWALEHLKVVTDLHLKLLQGYGKSPYKEQQYILISGLYNHHRKTGLQNFINKIFKPMLSHCPW